MYIYKTTNLLNNKIYIGKCSAPFNNSKRYLGSGVLLRADIEAYGRKNFTKELLKECSCSKELCESETYFIDLYKSNQLNIGYNIQKKSDCKHNKSSKDFEKVALSIYLDSEKKREIDDFIFEKRIRKFQDAYREIISLGWEQIKKNKKYKEVK